MPRRILSLILFLSLMLSGCSAISGSYVSITPHQVQYKSPEIEVASASSYSQLRDVMEGIVSAGIESATIQVSDYPSQQVERGMLQACRYIREMFPMGAYNVSDIGYELGTHMGKPAIAVSIQYRHRQSEIQQIHNIEQSTDAEPAIGLALAKLEEMGKLSAVVTQNIDGLHQMAGSREVLELHGSVHRNYCMKCKTFHSVQFVRDSAGVPTCSCGGTVKPDVVLYEESLDGGVINGALADISNADMLIIGGTSLAVYPAASLVNYYRGSRLVLINKSPTPYDSHADLTIAGPIGAILDQIQVR